MCDDSVGTTTDVSNDMYSSVCWHVLLVYDDVLGDVLMIILIYVFYVMRIVWECTGQHINPLVQPLSEVTVQYSIIRW